MPAWKRRNAILVGAVALLSLAHLLWFNQDGWVFSLMDRVSFFAIALFSWTRFRAKRLSWRDFRAPALLALAVVSGYGLWQMYQVGFPGEMPYTKVGSFFGYANITAQFVAISLLLLLGLGLPKPRSERLVTGLVAATALAYLVLLRGRSVLIGFALAAGLSFFLRLRKGAFRVGWLLAGIAATLVLFVGFQMLRGKSLGEAASLRIFAEKSSMFEYRFDVWKQTLRMIEENPLGVGADRFEFKFVPYHRFGTTLSSTSLALSPHNEFLRYPAEDGVPLALAYLALLLLFLRAWARRSSESSRFLLLPLGLFYALEMLFQFPWQTGFPVFFGAVAFGAMAAEAWTGEWRPKERVGGALLVALLFGQFVGTAEAFLIRSFENSRDPDRLAAACSLGRNNWRACMQRAHFDTGKGDYASARRYIEGELDRSPWNYHAWRRYAALLQRQGDRLGACFYMWRYADLFNDQPVRAQLKEACQQKWLDYFERKRPTKYFPRGS